MRRATKLFVAALLSACVPAVGCNAIFGLSEGEPRQATGGSGGSGGVAPQCSDNIECNDDNACTSDACLAGGCVNLALNDVVTAEQTAGDCKQNVCIDGERAELSKDDDIPSQVDCRVSTCLEGELIVTDEPLGTACDSDTKICNGEGACVECVVASDCTALPEDNECRQRFCDDGVCGQTFAAAGTPLDLQTDGDCLETVCDGSGGDTIQNDDADVQDDGNDCTTDVCDNGTPNHIDLNGMQMCGLNNTLNCVEGVCTGCSSPSECDTGEFCLQWACTQANCVSSPDNEGELTGSQTSEDCQKTVCQNGMATTVADSTDLPVDGNDCTQDLCVNGSPQNPDEPLDTACGTLQYCDGAGSCVDCNNPTQCPKPTLQCVEPSCDMNVCGEMDVAAGKPTASQTSGDCKTAICDGMGGVTSQANPNDPFIDGNECTQDLCNGSTPENPPTAKGSSCTIGGLYCDGMGTCVECTTHRHCTSLSCVGFKCDGSGGMDVQLDGGYDSAVYDGGN